MAVNLLTVSSHGRRQKGKRVLWVYFIRALIPLMRASPNELPKAPRPIPSHTLGVQHVNFTFNNIQS